MSNSRPFPSTSFTKGFALQQLQDVPDTAFALTPEPHFTRQQFDPTKNYSAWGNRAAGDFPGFFSDTGTKVVRLWADWDAIQDRGKGYNLLRLGALDRQIYDAKQDGRIVILTARGFPGWVSGYAAPNGKTVNGAPDMVPIQGDKNGLQPKADYASVANFPDATQRAAAETVWDNANIEFSKDGGGREVALRWPGDPSRPTNYAEARTDLLEEGNEGRKAWFTWLQFLAQRYHRNTSKRDNLPTGNGAPPPVPAKAGWIDLLEFVNEPNLECWPQRPSKSSTYPISALMTAQMLRSARTIESRVNSGVDASEVMYFGGPATSDFQQGNSRLVSNYFTFLNELAVALRAESIASTTAAPFPGKNFVFTHHSYIDVEDEHQKAASARDKTPNSRVNSVSWALRWASGEQVRFNVQTNPTAPPGVEKKYKKVPFQWNGWPDGDAKSKIALTEGGARLGHTGYSLDRARAKKRPYRKDVDPSNQGQKITDQIDYFGRSSITKGRVVLVTNFLSWSAHPDKGNDSSLTMDYPFIRNVPDANGKPVPTKFHIYEMNDAQDPPSTTEMRARQDTGYRAWKKL